MFMMSSSLMYLLHLFGGQDEMRRDVLIGITHPHSFTFSPFSSSTSDPIPSVPQDFVRVK